MSRRIVSVVVFVLLCSAVAFAGWSVDVAEDIPGFPIVISAVDFWVDQYGLYANTYDPSTSSIYYVSPRPPSKDYSWNFVECISGVEPKIVEMAETPFRTYHFAYIGEDNAVYYLAKSSDGWLQQQVAPPFDEPPRFVNIVLTYEDEEYASQIFFQAISDGENRIYIATPDDDGWTLDTIGVPDDGWGLQAVANYTQEGYKYYLFFYNPTSRTLKLIRLSDDDHQELTLATVSGEPEFLGYAFGYREETCGIIYRNEDRLEMVSFAVNGSTELDHSVIYEGVGRGTSIGLRGQGSDDAALEMVFYEPSQREIILLTVSESGWSIPRVIWELPPVYVSAKVLLFGFNYEYYARGLLLALEDREGLYKIGVAYENEFWNEYQDDDDDCGGWSEEDDDTELPELDDDEDEEESGGDACGCIAISPL